MAVELVLLEDKPDPNPATQFFTGGVDSGTNLVDLGISTTLQTGDVLFVMHGAEGAQNNQPAPGTTNLHPSGITITTTTTGSGTNPSWTDFGYQRGGENNGNVNNRNNIGAFCCVIGSGDNKSNFKVRLSFTDTIRQQRRTVRLYCLRGVDTTNFSSLSTIARTSARSQAELGYHAWTKPNALHNNQTTLTDDFMAIFSTSVRQTGTITTAPVPTGFTRIEPLGFPNDATGSPPSSWQNWDVFGTGTTATIGCYSTGTTYRHWTYFKPYTSFSGFNVTNFYAMDHSATDHNGGASLLLLFPAASTGTEYQRPQVDASTAVDSLDSVQSGTDQVSDSGSATDTLFAVKQSVVSAADSAESTDTLDTLQAGAFTALDSSTVVDTKETLQSGSVTFTDSVDSVDSLSAEKTNIFEATDSVTTTDSLDDIQPSIYSVSDSGSAVDTLTVEQQSAVDFTDSAEARDEIAELQIDPEFLSSNGSAVDSLEIVQFSAVQFTDTASVVDDADLVKFSSQNIDFADTDGSSATDSLDTLQEVQSRNTDRTSGTDTFFSEKQINLSVTDSSNATDSLDAVLSANFNVQDSVSALDTLFVQKSVVFSKTDTSETQDTLSATKESTEELTDTSEVSDELLAIKPGILSINEEDTSPASDTLSATKEAQSSNTDSTEVSDTLSVEKSISSEEQDTSEVSDSLSTTVQHSAFITDSVSSSDVFSAPAQKEVFITDTSESGDTVFPIKTITVGLLDTVSGSDLVGSQTDREIILTDTVSVLDELLAVGPVTKEIIATIIGNGGIDFNLMKEAQAVATIDVWNVALNALGISTLATTEGNNPQQTLLSNTFSLFRKQFLSDHLWNGAKRTTDLTKLDVNTTDQSVANRWKYVYVLPTDCMRVWRLNGQENKPVHVGGNSNIYTNRWEIEVVTKGTTGGDTNTGRYRALCTNEDEARIEYVFDVNNDIDLLGPLTQHAMGLALAAFVATNFGKSASEIAQLEAQAKDAITAAKGVDGQEGTPQIFGDTSLLGVRSIGY